MVDTRTLRSTPERGARAGWDGHKRTNGSKAHPAMDTRGDPLAVTANSVDGLDREHVGELLEKVRAAPEHQDEVAFADQGYTCPAAAAEAREVAVAVTVIKLPGTKDGFSLLPRCWVIERT